MHLLQSQSSPVRRLSGDVWADQRQVEPLPDDRWQAAIVAPAFSYEFSPAATATSNLTNQKHGGNSAKASMVVSERPFAP